MARQVADHLQTAGESAMWKRHKKQRANRHQPPVATYLHLGQRSLDLSDATEFATD